MNYRRSFLIQIGMSNGLSYITPYPSRIESCEGIPLERGNRPGVVRTKK